MPLLNLIAKGDILLQAARSGQSVTRAGSILIMFGGEDSKGHKMNDLHILDLKSLMWLPLHTTSVHQLPPCCFHPSAFSLLGDPEFRFSSDSEEWILYWHCGSGLVQRYRSFTTFQACCCYVWWSISVNFWGSVQVQATKWHLCSWLWDGEGFFIHIINLDLDAKRVVSCLLHPTMHF